MTDLTKPELYQLAVGIAAGAVFTDRHIENPDEIGDTLGLIFMPLLFLDDDTAEKLINEAGLLYEWVSRAHSQMDGYPCFTSVQWLPHDDAEWVWDQVLQIVSVGELLEKEQEAQDAEANTA